MEVSVRELKDHLSAHLRRAQQGEEIVVTSHGKPVGRLTGMLSSQTTPETEATARLRAQPWLRPGNGKPVVGSECPAPVPEGTVRGLVDWVRGE